jgi:hypothetical protein
MENPLSSGNTHVLLIGNPTQPTGGFRKAFLSELYNHIHISCFDTPNFTEFGITMDDIRANTWEAKIDGKPLPYPPLINPKWVYGRFKEWGEGSYHFQVYCLGNFPSAGVNNLIRLEDVEAAMAREKTSSGTRLAALDVSRYGDDETVYGERCGDSILPFVTWSHQETTYTAGRTLRYIRNNHPSVCVVDAVGVGGGVADMLKQEPEKQTDIIEINVGVPAKDKETFGNRRAELYWMLKKRLEENRINLPQDDVLKAQLCDIRYRYDSKGKIWIETKEEMRSRGSNSPDRADVVIMLLSSEATLGMANRRISKPMDYI